MPPNYASTLTTWFTSRWQRGPKVHIAPTARHLPVPAPEDARGLFYKGEVHVVAEQAPTTVVQTLAHEAVGHYGMRKWLGAEWPTFMRGIQNGAKSGDKGLRQLQAHIRQTYVDGKGNYQLSARQESDEIAAYAAEELICYQTGTLRPDRAWQKAFLATRGRLIREGLLLDGSISREELDGALFLAAKHMEAGPWSKTQDRISTFLASWGIIWPMAKFDPLKRPPTYLENMELLRRADQQVKDKEERAFLWSGVVGIVCLVGIVGAIGLMLFGVAQMIFGR